MKRTSTRYPWSLKLLALAAVLLLGAGVSAQAQQLCAMTGAEKLRTDQPSYSLGQTVRLLGTGYAANCDVTVQAIRPDGQFDTNTATTGPDGSLSFSYSATAKGAYSVDVIGADNMGLASASFRNGPEVVTDKGDYHPGETVTMTGSHFQPGEPISLRVREDSTAVADRLFTAVADSNGGFVSTAFVPNAGDALLNFTLTATGQSSGLVAEAQFKDSFATISWVKNVGQASHGTGFFNSLTVTIPSGASVASGNSLIVSIFKSTALGAITCIDDQENTYNFDIGTGNQNQSAILSTHNVSGLIAGNSIVCTFPTSSTGSGMSINEFSGLAPAPLDKVAGSAGTSTTPNSGLTASATTQTNELVFGYVNSVAFTPGTTGSNPAETYANPPNSDPFHSVGAFNAIFPVYRVVSTARQYQVNGTGGGTGGWRAMVATYKAAQTFTLTYTAGANGTISGNSPQTVSLGGSGTTVTAQPNTGYHFVNWSDGSTTNPRKDTSVTADIAVTANFAIDTFTLTYAAGANGSISGSASQTVNYGTNGSAVTAVPAAGYHFVSWSDSSTANPRTDTNVAANISVTASFAINTYTLTYTAGANGAITGTSPQTVNSGASGSAVTAVPNTGYHFTQWSDGSTANPRTDSNVTANVNVTATFAINTYTVTGNSGGNGTITPASQSVNYNATGTLTVTPNTGYHIDTVSGCGGMLSGNTFTTGAVTADCAVTATFAINTYTLTYTAGSNGSITGSSPQTVNYGASGTTVTATPNAGYHFVSWSDGGANASRTDSNVMADLGVTATFAINQYTLVYNAGSNGSISGSSSQTVNYGASGTTVTATPNAGYHFVSWSDGGANASRTDSNVVADLGVTATFAINSYSLVYNAGSNGSISGTSPQSVSFGGSGSAVTAVPNTGYSFVSWSDGVMTASRTDSNVMTNLSVTATFAINTYTLTYAASANGALSGISSQTVSFGGSGSAVAAVPNSGYHFTQWSDGSTDNPRTDSNVSANLSVTAAFEINAATDTQGPITSNVLVSPVAISGTGDLTATVSDTTTGNSNIVSAEFNVNGGSWSPMVSVNGFDSPSENVKVTLDPGTTTGLPTATGVYTICVRGTDAAGNVGAPSCGFLAVYDPSGGFVTGGGWINSPAGAYAANPTMTGKANFGFNSKYLNGQNVPSGETQFSFKAGNLDFHANVYEWMVVSGAKARYRGTGTINGSGSFGFELTAWDGNVSGGGGVDKFRIQIWDNNQGNAMVYDNMMNAPAGADPTTTLGGGSIVIHK